MRWWPFAVYCVLVFLYIGGEVGISGWIYTYILQNDLANAPTAAKINSLYWLGITMGRLASIPLAARFRIANLVTGNLAGVLAAVSLLLFFPHTLSAVWISAFLIGLFVAAIFPMTFAYLEQQTPVTGSRAGILWASGSFGAMLLPWWMGTLLRVSGPQVFPISLLTVWGAATVLFVVIVKINTRN
jgi:fucose permease